MRIETYDEYLMAIDRLRAIGEYPAQAPDHDEFLDISAAMLDYETRGHPVLSETATVEGGRDVDA